MPILAILLVLVFVSNDLISQLVTWLWFCVELDIVWLIYNEWKGQIHGEPPRFPSIRKMIDDMPIVTTPVFLTSMAIHAFVMCSRPFLVYFLSRWFWSLT